MPRGPGCPTPTPCAPGRRPPARTPRARARAGRQPNSGRGRTGCRRRAWRRDRCCGSTATTPRPRGRVVPEEDRVDVGPAEHEHVGLEGAGVVRPPLERRNEQLQIVADRRVQEHTQTYDGTLVRVGRGGRHDERSVDQLVSAAVVGHPLEVGDGEGRRRRVPDGHASRVERTAHPTTLVLGSIGLSVSAPTVFIARDRAAKRRCARRVPRSSARVSDHHRH